VGSGHLFRRSYPTPVGRAQSVLLLGAYGQWVAGYETFFIDVWQVSPAIRSRRCFTLDNSLQAERTASNYAEKKGGRLLMRAGHHCLISHLADT
jgi:hypothetical protein